MNLITGVAYGRIDLNKAVQAKRGLNKWHIDVLQRNGYKQIRDPGFSQGMGTAYYIKNLTGEPDEHFILCNLLFDEIQRYTSMVEYNLTLLPDIIFGLGDGHWVAIEVEDKLKTKDEALPKLFKMTGYDDYFYLVTNWDLLEHFQEYGPTFTRRSVRDKIASYFEPPSRPE